MVPRLAFIWALDPGFRHCPFSLPMCEFLGMLLWFCFGEVASLRSRAEPYIRGRVSSQGAAHVSVQRLGGEHGDVCVRAWAVRPSVGMLSCTQGVPRSAALRALYGTPGGEEEPGPGQASLVLS